MRELYNILVEDGIVSGSHMDSALKAQEEEGGLLGLILLKKGYISRTKLKENLLKD